jgi:hypothetical protein
VPEPPCPRWGSRVRIPSSAPGQKRFGGPSVRRRVTLLVTVELQGATHAAESRRDRAGEPRRAVPTSARPQEQLIRVDTAIGPMRAKRDRIEKDEWEHVLA